MEQKHTQLAETQEGKIFPIKQRKNIAKKAIFDAVIMVGGDKSIARMKRTALVRSLQRSIRAQIRKREIIDKLSVTTNNITVLEYNIWLELTKLLEGEGWLYSRNKVSRLRNITFHVSAKDLEKIAKEGILHFKRAVDQAITNYLTNNNAADKERQVLQLRLEIAKLMQKSSQVMQSNEDPWTKEVKNLEIQIKISEFKKQLEELMPSTPSQQPVNTPTYVPSSSSSPSAPSSSYSSAAFPQPPQFGNNPYNFYFHPSPPQNQQSTTPNYYTGQYQGYGN